uniref:Uncharacterized protein n=1 Tax=Tetranychus urticae TaxID=32264 RepID=T1KDN2_TETUR
MNQLWRLVDIVTRNVHCESELSECEEFFDRVIRVITDYESTEISIDSASSTASSMTYSSSSISGSSDDASEIGLDDKVSLVCNSVLGPSPPPPPPNPQSDDINRIIMMMERLIVSTNTHNDIDDRLCGDV